MSVETYLPEGGSKLCVQQFSDATGQEYNIPECVCLEIRRHLSMRGKVYFGGRSDYAVAATTGYIDLLVLSDSVDTSLRLIDAITDYTAKLEVWEGVTATGNGTEIALLNRKRKHTTACTSKLYHTPTGLSLDGAVKLVDQPVIAGTTAPGVSPGVAVAGGTSQERSIFTKTNTKYYIKLSNLTAEAAMMSLAVEIKEEDMID